MRRIVAIAAILSCSALLSSANGPHESSGQRGEVLPAATPPMGWNSWDSYGTTVTESDIRSTAEWMAQNLKRYGWTYVVVDMEWFVTNPTPAGNSPRSKFAVDENGRYIPAVNRFPSAANNAGFKPLADYIHSLGLKFGVHMLRGIPKQAVEANLPIADSVYHARDAANTSDTCSWNPDNYGIDGSKTAGQAYYDSVAKLYAEWGVDLVKIDCIANPYKGDEVRILSTALHRTNPAIVVSLSPGPAPIDEIAELRKYAQMWRISNDVWDLWHSPVAYPQGLSEQFAHAAQWAGYSEAGHWPDADMLPLGYLGPAPGWGKARMSRLTEDEERTLMTLWCIFRSPLMWGGNPARSDPFTISLLTNPEVLQVDQHSTASREVIHTDTTVAWVSDSSSGNKHYVAVLNLSDAPQTLHLGWKEFMLPAGAEKVRDLWHHTDSIHRSGMDVQLPAHGSMLYSIR